MLGGAEAPPNVAAAPAEGFRGVRSGEPTATSQSLATDEDQKSRMGTYSRPTRVAIPRKWCYGRKTTPITAQSVVLAVDPFSGSDDGFELQGRPTRP